MRHHYTPIRMAKIQNADKTKSQQGCGATRIFIHRWQECKLVHTATLEDSLAVSYKTKHTLTIQSSNCAPCIYSEESKTYVHIKTCAWMFTTTLFIIAKTWRQPRCPSVGEWINKWRHIQAMEYYSVLKNELSNFEKET